MPGHRLFAAVYDRVLAGSEKAGLSAMRAELLSRARGRTLELGAGTGHNLEHYGKAVTELVLTEPDPHMAKRLRMRAKDAGLTCAVEVSESGAEQLPFRGPQLRHRRLRRSSFAPSTTPSGRRWRRRGCWILMASCS